MQSLDPKTGRSISAPESTPPDDGSEWTVPLGIFILLAVLLIGVLVGHHLAPECAG